MNPYIGFCKLGDKLKAKIAQQYKTLNKESVSKKRRYAMVVEYRFIGGTDDKINYVTVASNVGEAINKAKKWVIDKSIGILEKSIIVTDIYSEPCEANDG